MPHQRQNPTSAPGTSAGRDEERRLQEPSVEEHLRFEKVLSELAAALVAFPDSDVDTSLQFALQHIADFLRIDQVALLEYDESETSLRVLNQYVASDLEGLNLLVPERLFPWCVARLREGERVVIAPTLGFYEGMKISAVEEPQPEGRDIADSSR